MNTGANVIPESPLQSAASLPAEISATRRMWWSMRRELWEYRSVYLAPLAVAALYLFGFLISMIRLPHRMRALAALDPAHQHEAIVMPYHLAAALIMAAAFLVGIFYSLDALYGERRDRSILFWKSLPVSDLTTVLSKASVPIVIVPLVSFAITAVTQYIMLLMSSAVLLGSGLSVATTWEQLSLFQSLMMLLYHLLTVHALWYAPIYGWLLLVSSWARRAPFLWAGLPLLAIGVFEKVAFNTTHFVNMLMHRIAGGPEAMPATPGGFPMDSMTHLTPGTFLSSPGLWIGLLLAAAFLAAAVRLRRYRGPI
jgi:ABC-2 type transport system permease protein